MNERFNPPTRDQLSRVSRGDIRLIRAFEQIFEVAGQDFYAVQEALTDVSAKADANEAALILVAADIATNASDIAALAVQVATNASDIVGNSARIKTNEVLAWLSV